MVKFPGQGSVGNKEVEADVKDALEQLPEGFWEMPEDFIPDPQIRELHKILYQRLREENSDSDTIENMMIERTASLFAYLKMYEKTGYKNTTDYRQLSQLWNKMANDLRETRTGNIDVAQVREELVAEFTEAILEAIRGFDITIATTVKQRLLKAITQ